MKPIGLYIHIPFCRRKCAYCAFYSVAGQEGSKAEAYGQALLEEAGQVFARRYGSEKPLIGTLYAGGGTPSLLPVGFYVRLLAGLSEFFDLSRLQEATFEANPEHLAPAYLEELRDRTPFGRLSIGVQSFFDDDLALLNRKHTGKEALLSVENARKAGFSDISVDLIYGLHARGSDSHWRENLRILASLQLPHFSAYALTVEPGTLLEKRFSRGQARIAGELLLEEEYFCLQDFAGSQGYEAYEISNYARPGKYALHNTNYWRGVPYIGLGASAHSFFGNERRWNPASLPDYLADPAGEKEGEMLEAEDLYHEYVMTALRTQWGVDMNELSRFPLPLRREFLARAARQVEIGNLRVDGGRYVVVPARRLLADGIASDFF